MNGTRQRQVSGAVLVVIGFLSLTVPVFDIQDDIVVQEDAPVTAIVENTPMLLLGVAVVVSGVWLATSRWEGRYARIVARTTVGNVVGVGVLVALIIGVQVELQSELKPIIIAADVVVIGAVSGILIGVRTAQQARAVDDADRQRARAEALFENHTDAVAFVAAVDGAPVVVDVNDEFRAAFGNRVDVGNDFQVLLDGTTGSADSLLGETVEGNRIRREVTRETPGGRREFIRQTVPLEAGTDGTREAYVVYTDITEQKEREQQLEFLNSLLRHDIQNGMTVIRSRAAHLSRTLDGREADFAATIESRSDDLADLTDRFRVMLDALTGDIDEERTTRSLPAVVDEQIETLRTSFSEVSVSTDIPDDMTVQADSLFENVVWNLLSNAVEHNDKDKPQVAVGARQTDGHVRVTVTDNGPGVPDDLKESIFRRGDSGVRNEVGSGFGLFFVDKMVTRYGGDIWVEDNDPEGAVFVMTLPSD